MVVLSRAIRCASTALNRHCACLGFHTSHSVRDHVNVSSKSVTKKSLSELPKSYMSANGVSLSPLGSWDGGLETSSHQNYVPASTTVAPLESPDSTSREVLAQAPLVSQKPIRKRRTKKELLAVLPDHAISNSNETLTSEATVIHGNTIPGESLTQAPTDESVSQKPIRKRRAQKVRTPVLPDDAIVSPLETQPTEHIVTPGTTDPIKLKRKTQTKAVVPKVNSDVCTTGRRPRNALAVGILNNLTKFPHCILLTRVGQFYESYFDQAAEVARLLNIKLAKRTWSGRRVLMCGFPILHLNKYLKVLVQHHNRFVAMCEEFPREPILGAKAGFDRRVVRIITPGTLIDEPFLNPYENNYLLAISPPKAHLNPDTLDNAKSTTVGLAWIDVSTGEFFAKNTSYDSLRDELVRISPREVVLVEDLKSDTTHHIRKTLAEEDCLISYLSTDQTLENMDIPLTVSEYQSSTDDVTSQLPTVDIPTSLSFSHLEIGAIKLLTAFLRVNLMEYAPQLSSPSRETLEGRMHIDSYTIKALEIREGMREGGTTGSLLSVVKRTVTTSGTRLLARWLCSPSMSISEITARQNLVAFFHSRPHLRADLDQFMGDVDDATRIVQKFLLGRGDVSDLSAICGTIDVWSSMESRIAFEKSMERQERNDFAEDDWLSLDALMSRMHDFHQLVDRIRAAIVVPATADIEQESDISATEGDDDISASDGNDYVPASNGNDEVSGKSMFLNSGHWTINPKFSEHLMKLHTTLENMMFRSEQLERELQVAYAAPSLTLRSSPGQGMYVHIGRAKRDAGHLRASPLFIPISESGSTISFFFQEWSQLGSSIMQTTTAISLAEKDAFETLRSEVIAHSDDLRRNARILDELDVTLAFANLATERNFIRPVLRADTSYRVVNGRHPTVELALLTAGRGFTPNTVDLEPESPVHIITGPNMAGKSTLLRQTALIAILAQIGSFVPADAADIGMVDRLFSRVGAKDDLFRDRSTFMVEMLETGEILRRATPNSLVIMDEVGRGTTVEDGLAIAFATVHHLLSVNGCRTLFATHFHELADMLGISDDHRGQGSFKGVRFYCTDVDETDDGYFAYSHQLRPGVNRDSHGIKVARLAGMPDSAVAVAEDALCWLKQRKADKTNERLDLQTLGQSLVAR